MIAFEIFLFLVFVIVIAFVYSVLVLRHSDIDRLDCFDYHTYDIGSIEPKGNFRVSEETLGVLSEHELKQLARVYNIETDGLTRVEICDTIHTYFK